MEKEIAPIRAEAERLRANPDEVRAILEKGATRCRALASEVMEQVHKITGLR
jgi:hypothetical protein